MTETNLWPPQPETWECSTHKGSETVLPRCSSAACLTAIHCPSVIERMVLPPDWFAACLTAIHCPSVIERMVLPPDWFAVCDMCSIFGVVWHMPHLWGLYDKCRTFGVGWSWHSCHAPNLRRPPPLG